MDITISPAGPAAWSLHDRLGRDIGRIEEDGAGELRITPSNRYALIVGAMHLGPFRTLDAALAYIEAFTHATCRMATTT